MTKSQGFFWRHPRRRLALAALLALAGAGWACHGTRDESTPAPVVTVEAATVATGPIDRWVRAEGLVFPVHRADITPKIAAPISQFIVNRGDAVKAGELVARLENRDLVAAAHEAQSEYEKAQADYQTAMAADIPAELQKARLDDRAAQQAYDTQQKIYASRQSLFEQGAIPRRELDQAAIDLTEAQNAHQLAQQHAQALESGGNAQAVQAAEGDLHAAQAHAEAAQAQVSYSDVRSPIDGVVTDRPLYAGEMASTGAPLMTIMDLSRIVAKAHLPADEAALLKSGDRATITAPGASPVAARVTVVSAATDAGSTTIEVWVEAPNPGGALRPGTSVEVAYLARTIPNALTVPAMALLTDPSGATSVMVLGADSKAHEQVVEVGIRNPDTVQITKGLKAGQRVISVGAYGLSDGTQVKVETPK